MSQKLITFLTIVGALLWLSMDTATTQHKLFIIAVGVGSALVVSARSKKKAEAAKAFQGGGI